MWQIVFCRNTKGILKKQKVSEPELGENCFLLSFRFNSRSTLTLRGGEVLLWGRRRDTHSVDDTPMNRINDTERERARESVCHSANDQNGCYY